MHFPDTQGHFRPEDLPRSSDYAVETPEGHHRPGETHNSFGVYTQNIVNNFNRKLDTYCATFGLTLHQQS